MKKRGSPKKSLRTTVPAIRLSAKEVRTSTLNQATLKKAIHLFQINGCLVLENVFSATLIARLRAAFVGRYKSYFVDKKHTDANRVGGKRFMITVKVEPPFDHPALFANPLVLPLLRALLGEDCVLGSFGSVAALPGAPDQHTHRDMPGLFGIPLDQMLPNYALTLIIPLVKLGKTNGTTRVWKASHALTKKGRSLPHQDPIVPQGSCLLMDYRLYHGGTANRAKQVRPILYFVYNRPWFKDYVNFYKQPPLVMSRTAYEKMSEKHRALFSNARVVGKS